MVKPTRDEINDFKLAVLKYVTDLYLNTNKSIEERGLHPTLFLMTPKGHRKKIPLPELFNDQNGKDTVADLMLEMIREAKSGLICFASEGWSLSKEGLEKLKDSGATMEEISRIRPSTHKDKIELLNLFFESYKGSSSLMSFIIERNDHHENPSVKLVPKKEYTVDENDNEDAKLQGRFSNLIHRAYNENVCDDCNVCDGNCKEDLNSEDHD